MHACMHAAAMQSLTAGFMASLRPEVRRGVSLYSFQQEGDDSQVSSLSE